MSWVSVLSLSQLKKRGVSAGLQSTDYILVQTNMHHQHARNFLLDAGASTFQSSLNWFLCSYHQVLLFVTPLINFSLIQPNRQQRGIMFDQLYGWEYTLLEPNKFWQCVPYAVKPIYHFFNVPITSNVHDPHSPLRHIQSIAREEDFVSFKLDVDTSSVEIPLVLQLVASSELLKLVDEFFFELHFRCEIMKKCGWGDSMPESVDWLKLDRVNTLSLFADMRRKGVRAHIWP